MNLDQGLSLLRPQRPLGVWGCKPFIISSFLLLFAACGGQDADSLGVGAECSVSNECNEDEGQACVLDFKGGYCGVKDCTDDSNCPDNAACVSHDDGNNYCFRICTDKAECNENRSPEQEANCSSSVTFVETQEAEIKACVPPNA